MTAPPRRYVAIGDSLSEGIGDEPWPDGTPRGWTDRLAELLAGHHGGVDYANLAVRGQRAHEVLATQVEAALVMEPDVVTLTAGMNDLLRPRFDPDVLRATLAEIVAPFTAKGACLVVVPIPDIRSVSPAGRLLDRHPACGHRRVVELLHLLGRCTFEAEGVAIARRRRRIVDGLAHAERAAGVAVEQAPVAGGGLVLDRRAGAQHCEHGVVERFRPCDVVAADHDVIEHGAVPPDWTAADYGGAAAARSTSRTQRICSRKVAVQ